MGMEFIMTVAYRHLSMLTDNEHQNSSVFASFNLSNLTPENVNIMNSPLIFFQYEQRHFDKFPYTDSNNVFPLYRY